MAEKEERVLRQSICVRVLRTASTVSPAISNVDQHWMQLVPDFWGVTGAGITEY